MSLVNTTISFETPDSNNCKTMVIVDTSYYAEGMTITGNILQVELPDRNKIIELNYVREGVTILNSNSLQYTNVSDSEYLTVLPDGAYTIKMSICPYNQYWEEKIIYRTCNLECKFAQALLKLEINTCTECYSDRKIQKMMLISMYIKAIQANVVDRNIEKANALYTKANSFLDDIINCDCD